MSWFYTVAQVSRNLFWVDRFNATEVDFGDGDTADFKISSLTDRIFVMYSFISVQKEFGYSDVSRKNEEEGRVTELFASRSEKLTQLDTVGKFYDLFS